ncbi:MAG: DUF3843 family protein, partial [Bacteroidales bacterium]|nr:DUF3843 family protein [Bacteroidales bacterium]
MSQHKELYGKYLPFYDPDEYYPDEINFEDIFFLSWYFMSMIQYDEIIINPVSSINTTIGAGIYNILNREYELAPENMKLKEFFKVRPGEDNFFNLRDIMEWIMLDSWLLHFNRTDYETDIVEALSDKTEDTTRRNVESYIYEITDSYSVSGYTPLLAKRGKDWLAYIQGSEHPLFEDILGISEKKTGYYFFMGKDIDYMQFQHIATDRVLQVTTRSLNSPEEFKAGKTINFLGFVKWKNDWWFSGASANLGRDADMIKKEKNSESSRS